jgi:cell division protein ZapA
MQIAILVAMEYCAESRQAQKKTEEIRAEIKGYLEDAAAAQSERDFYKREIERMKENAKAADSQLNFFDGNKD